MMTLGPKASAGVTAFVILALARREKDLERNIPSLYIVSLRVCSWLTGWL